VRSNVKKVHKVAKFHDNTGINFFMRMSFTGKPQTLHQWRYSCLFILQLASYILLDNVELTHAKEMCLTNRNPACVTYVAQKFPACVRTSLTTFFFLK